VAFAILVAAALVLVYITLGGLTSAIYNEVLQFFVIVAALLPLPLVLCTRWAGSAGSRTRSRRSPSSATPVSTLGRAWPSTT
jgi:solute:Na+ symporter, SSS family